MIKRLDQQYRVTRLMLEIYNNSKIDHENIDKAMVHYFDMMMCVSSILSIREGSKQRLDVKESNTELYEKVRKSILGRTMNLPGKAGRQISVIGYKIANKFVGFN